MIKDLNKCLMDDDKIDSMVINQHTYGIMKSKYPIEEEKQSLFGKVAIITHSGIPKGHVFLRNGTEVKAIIDLEHGGIYKPENTMNLDIGESFNEEKN